jgi:hypothetical protein
VRDPEEPARKPAAGVEGRELEVGLDERLLSQVLGERSVAVPEQACDEADDRTLIAPDDAFERGLGSGERFGDQPGLRDRLEIDRNVRVLSLRPYAGRALALREA